MSDLSSTTCFICRRLSDQLAVGKLNALKWFCLDCTAQLAKDCDAMPKMFAEAEKRAIEKVAAGLPADQFLFPAEELPEFVRYIVEDFGKAVREEAAQLPPF